MVRDPESGKYRRAQLFVLTLGYCRKVGSTSGVPIKLANKGRTARQAFRRLGGVTRWLLDNLREAVLTPDIYNPTLNPLYRDILRHYGAVPVPYMVGHPDRKGPIESGSGTPKGHR